MVRIIETLASIKNTLIIRILIEDSDTDMFKNDTK